MKWDYYTEIGSRTINEDYCLSVKKDKVSCFVLADGLGAHQKGEEASRFVCSYVVEHFEPGIHQTSKQLEELIRRSNAELIRFQTELGIKKGLRTTLVVLVITETTCIFANVGDSRLYQIMGNQIIFQTKDQSVCQKLVEMGEITTDEMRNHPDRGKLLMALGEVKDLTRIQSGSFDLTQCTFLLCTDGLWENVYESELISSLQVSSTPRDYLDHIKSTAQTRGHSSMDNHSAIAIFIE